MNTDLYNEMLERQSDGSLQEFLTEKIAELELETEEEVAEFCKIANEKLMNIDALKKILGMAAVAAIPTMLLGRKIHNDIKYKSTFEKIINSKPNLRNNLERTKKHFEALWHLAPTLMSNYVLAGSILEQVAQYDLIDHQMIGKIVDAEKNLKQSKDGGAMGAIESMGNMAKSVTNITDLMRNRSN